MKDGLFVSRFELRSNFERHFERHQNLGIEVDLGSLAIYSRASNQG
jgi:hypothetical protein